MICYTFWSSVVLCVFLIHLVESLNNDLSDRSDFSSEGFDGDKEDSSSNEVSMRTVLREDVIKSNLVFHYYKNGNKTLEDKGLNLNLSDSGCLPSDKFAFILHGWGQDCEVEWMDTLREKLTTNRGGCIVCIDYGFFKGDSYLRLLRYFRIITNIITDKLQVLQTQGFEPSRGFMFGFSLGGQMATNIGKQFGPTRFKQIQTCDMAGPGFDFRRSTNHREAAEQVTCWHTSRNKGTRFYTCHQNVRFGNCGHSQPAESILMSSHGLCVSYYINAFDYPFYAGLQPYRCTSRNPAIFIPGNYTVGYTEDSKSLIAGDVFVPTGKVFPYNLPLEQVLKLNSIIRNNATEGNAIRKPHRRRFPLLMRNARKLLLHKIRN